MILNNLIYLSNADPVADASIPLTVVVAIITAIIGGLVGKRSGEKSQVTIEPNPLGVHVHDKFVTRREHDEFKGSVGTQFARLEAVIQRQQDNVDRKHLELLATIEAAAKSGVNGRVALWEDVKKNGEHIAALNAKVEIAEELKRLLKSIALKERKLAEAAAASLKEGGTNGQS